MTELSARARKILYRCAHRGTKELDLILGSFARTHVPDLDAASLDALEVFTELPEPVLQEVLTGKAPLPTDMPEPLRGLLANYRYTPPSR